MSLFMICFVTGLGILLFNLIFGSISDFFSLDFDIDLGLDGSDHMAHGILGFLSPSSISAFLISFGGMGVFFEAIQLAIWLIWLLSIIAGFIAAYALYSLMRFLKRHENGAAVQSEEMVGKPALVCGAILESGYGAIRYSLNGHTFTSPAVSFDGNAIPAGTSVAIVSIKDHLFLVSPLESEE